MNTTSLLAPTLDGHASSPEAIRQQAEAALRESERLLRVTQTIAGLGTYVMDVNTGAWTSSSVLDDILGIGPHYDRTAEGWVMLVHPDWRDRMAQCFADEVLSRRGRFDLEYKILRPLDREERWVHGRGEFDLDLGGGVTDGRMVGTITDITGRKRTEATMLNQLEELKRWQQAMLNRSDRNQKLKREVNDLLLRLGEPSRYPSQSLTAPPGPTLP